MITEEQAVEFLRINDRKRAAEFIGVLIDSLSNAFPGEDGTVRISMECIEEILPRLCSVKEILSQ